ncbi:lantibiotic dehydratase [Actinomadura craniellae]|uniref:Lantibiotic dehydratase n=1 Tax=Actinomadura craniellae TaxID=2231787 RepID=A0A365H7B0_9ACTN|nr:lantibiotic dehydratase [Actinomadura craniellae]RAY15000.1 lantibiotic dehydratase [Actinomadura craniellae]
MYQPLDAAVIRMTAWPPHTGIPAWPDLTGPAGQHSWQPWLETVMRLPAFAAAVEQASPALARRVHEILAGKRVAEPDARRATLATARYLLRALGRATPFGLFAGVAPARISDRAALGIGTGHRPVSNVDSAWLGAVIERLEADPALLRRLPVVRHDLIVERDGEVLLTHRPAGGAGGAPVQVRVRATPAVRAALRAASAPIRSADLAAHLAAAFPGVPGDVITRLLAELVDQRLLITSLRSPMTVTDPLPHLLAELDAVSASDIPQLAGTVTALREAGDALARRTIPEMTRSQRAELAVGTAKASVPADRAVRTDLRMDVEVTVPSAVADEAARAASALVRLAPRGDLGRGWAAWHREFLERYGPHALVPVRDAVDPDIGLGFPAGYLSAPAAPAPAMTGRDHKLLALAQNAALRGDHEVTLDDAAIAELADTGPRAAVQPSTELTVRVHAASVRALDDGDFALSITGVSRNAGTTTGRFLHLLAEPDRDRMRLAYADLPTVTRGAILAQLSAPPLYAATENVARSLRALPHLLALGEHHPAGADVIALDDLAITADIDRILLISRSLRRPVEPVALTAVEPVRQTHPLARFLLEAPTALAVPCTAFDWGAASRLPFLPALRYGRTLLSPARWLLPAAALPGPEADGNGWDHGLTAWREQTGLPLRVYAGDGDRRLGLDLAEPAHRAVLRSLLRPDATLTLRAAPAPDASGWIDGRAHEIVIPLASTREPAPPPRLPRHPRVPGRDHGHLPGSPGRFYLKLYSHPGGQNAILLRHLPHLVDALDGQATWWFLRYRDPHDHLRLRLTVPAARSAAVTARLADWSDRLRQAGLVGRVQWDTYFPEEGRFGAGATMAVAEAYFAADSTAALAQLAIADRGDTDPQALTAASILDITAGLLGSPAAATRWLIDHACTTTPAPARPLYRQAVTLADPDQHQVSALPGGDHLLACWARRRQKLRAYRALTDARSARELLPDLLHLHHTRMAGLDLPGERRCLHLARAAALSRAARAKGPR